MDDGCHRIIVNAMKDITLITERIGLILFVYQTVRTVTFLMRPVDNVNHIVIRHVEKMVNVFRPVSVNVWMDSEKSRRPFNRVTHQRGIHLWTFYWKNVGIWVFLNFFFSCQPYCENCTNGKCTEPQQCTCNSGYKRNVLLNECQPDCQPNCTNGKCIEPNRCVCNFGFVFAAINSTDAAPTCVRKATDAPESSTTKEQSLTTTFSAPTESEQSTTTATDVSSKIEDLTFCFHQNCSTDGCNKCPDGYKVTASSSSSVSPIMFCCPMCSVACVHGNCVEPEMCLCWQGYRVSNSYNATDSNMCHPICASSSDNITDACINGHCVAYNQCECFAGFELSGASVDNVTCVAKSE